MSQQNEEPANHTDSRTWLLSFELATLEDALLAAAWLSEQVDEQGSESERGRKLAFGAAAVTTLVALRLRDLGRVLRGELDPLALHADHNAGDEQGVKRNRGRAVVFGAARR